MTRKLPLAVVISGILVLGAAAAAEAAPTQLVLSQAAAFAILGHSCGGIQEQAYGTGFDATTGDPLGAVYLSTRCGGSGRGGGYKTTTYSAWASVTWSFDGSTAAFAKLATAPSVDPSFSAYDAHGDHLYNASNQAYLDVLAPAAPSNVTVAPSGGEFLVSWNLDPTAEPALITSSTVTATPRGSTTSPVTATVNGDGANTLLGPLQPLTTYDVTVVSTDAAGPSAPSAAVSLTTGASVIAPGAPTGVKAHWTAPGSPNDTLVATWLPAPPGDSPTNHYRVRIIGSDGGGTFNQTVSGSTLTATFAVSDIPDWKVQVRAHDAAGWGPWSTGYTLGGT